MRKKDIRILSVTCLKGPSVWTYRPVLEALVDIGELEDFPSNTLPGFVERLTTWLPSLIEHRCSYEVHGGFVRRLHEGTWPAHIMEHVTLELQNLAGLPGGFGKAREISQRGVYKVIVRAWHEDVTRAALVAARDLVMAAINDEPFDVAETVERLKDMTDSLLLGPSTACIVDAADDRDIPFIRLKPDANLVQLGHGARMRRIWTAETDRTSAIAEGISRDKDLTKQLLEACGVPVPEGRLVDNAEDAWAAAEEIGVPVVIKPYDGNHGRGVFTNVTTREETLRAYDIAVDEGNGVIVERFVPGDEHRLLVVGGRMVAAAKGEPAWVKGDGEHTVRELIDLQLNTDPRRGRGEEFPLNYVGINSAAEIELERQGLTPDAVPAKDRDVLIQINGNVAFDVTERVHPSVAADVALAAKVVGLDIAGIDLVAKDISRPLAEQGGAIVEVNAGPGLLMHLKPASGTPQPVGRAIVEHLFPEGDTGRIPLVGITGTDGTTPVAHIVAHLLQLAGHRVGLASGTGLAVAGRVIATGNQAHWAGGQRLLRNRSVEAAVIENGPPVIAGEGLAYDRCRIGIVTRIDPAYRLPAFHMASRESIWKLIRTQVDVVLADGAAVLNAHDDDVLEMAALCDGPAILFATDPRLESVTTHLATGGKAALLANGDIVIAHGADRAHLINLDTSLSGGNWRGSIRIESLLAGVAAAIGMGLPLDLLRTGINTYVPALDK